MKTYLLALQHVVVWRGYRCLWLGLLIFFVSCGSSRDSGIPQNYEELTSLVNTRDFEIQNEWANPLAGSMINLLGNPNYIRFKGDSVDVFLPYFGVRHTGGGYNKEGGFKFKGPVENLSIVEEDDRNRIMLRFDGEMGTEDLNFLITLYQDGSANTSVNSSHRNMISYRGDLRKIMEEK